MEGEEEKLKDISVNDELECNSCGAILKFKPGTHHLNCQYCGALNEIFDTSKEVIIEEIPLEQYFREGLDKEERLEVVTIRCQSCGAESTFDSHVSSDKCPFCGESLVVESGSTASMYKPKYILPFDIDDKHAHHSFKRWLKSLWFAPNDVKHYGDHNENLQGVYIPYWTYDCHTDTEYTGERGDDYFVQQRVNGKTQSVRKTRWSRAGGRVKNFFDDILVIASKSLPLDKMARIRAWDVQKLVPYDDKYLSGFRAETYQVKIEEGYETAKARMEQQISYDVRRDIGGDRQQIHRMNTQYSGATFKQILVPVWLSAYRYNGKTYHFIINGRTGALSGDRPYSALKIALAVIAGLIIVALFALYSG